MSMAWRGTALPFFLPLFEEFRPTSHANCGNTEINLNNMYRVHTSQRIQTVSIIKAKSLNAVYGDGRCLRTLEGKEQSFKR